MIKVPLYELSSDLAHMKRQKLSEETVALELM
jgi:hypothetical protein